MIKIKYKESEGYFITDAQFEEIKAELERAKSLKEAHQEAEEHLKYKLAIAEKDVEIARNESKYKLKKLASIIERKEKMISELTAKLGAQ